MTSVVTPKEVLPAKIVGKAIYLELHPNPALDEDTRKSVSWNLNTTRQLIIFPAWTDDSGKTHNARYMSRDISSVSPRSQWGFNSGIVPIGELKADEDSYYADRYYTYDNLKADQLALMSDEDKVRATLSNITLVLQREFSATKWERIPDPTTGESTPVTKAFQGWAVRENKPLAIEVTDEDMKLVATSTTPQAVIRRINKVRATIDNFPEKLG